MGFEDGDRFRPDDADRRLVLPPTRPVNALEVDSSDDTPRRYYPTSPTVTGIYGINAAGKDTLAAALRDNCLGKAVITSESRVLMFGLGIVDNPDATARVETEAYKRLEAADPARIAEIEANMGQLLMGLKNDGNNVFFLSHLIFANHLADDQVRYLVDKPIHPWIGDVVDVAVHLRPPAETILQRRQQALQVRQRPVSLEQIIEHQALCDDRWGEYVSMFPGVNYAEVQNAQGAEIPTANAIADFIVRSQNHRLQSYL